MSLPALHYVFDPLCGWCYAASPLLRRLVDTLGDALPVRFHPGLLFGSRRLIDPTYREHILAADQRIVALAGVSFGEAYLERVRHAPRLEYYSMPPAAAVMAVHALQAEATVAMLEDIQRAHYIDGADVGDLRVLVDLAVGLGLEADRFERGYSRALQALPGQANQARSLLLAGSGGGIPSFLLEVDGRNVLLDHNNAHANPEELILQISTLIGECVQ